MPKINRQKFMKSSDVKIHGSQSGGAICISPYCWWRVWVFVATTQSSEYSAAQAGEGPVRNRPGYKQKRLDGCPLGLPWAILPPGDRPWKMNNGDKEEAKSYLISSKPLREGVMALKGTGDGKAKHTYSTHPTARQGHSTTPQTPLTN